MRLCAEISHSGYMEPVSLRLKQLRKLAKPRLTVRRIAEEMEIPFGTYSFYESPSTFKKPHLPLDFARKVAAVMARYDIDPAEVMKLAGLVDEEIVPEAKAIEAQRSSVIHLMMPVALPSEAALTDMFRALLSIVPEGASRDETAQILARRLPAGFAGIGPFLPEQGAAQVTGGEDAAPVRAIDHPAGEPPSHRQ